MAKMDKNENDKKASNFKKRVSCLIAVFVAESFLLFWLFFAADFGEQWGKILGGLIKICGGWLYDGSLCFCFRSFTFYLSSLFLAGKLAFSTGVKWSWGQIVIL